jgi:hypothetical protein
VVYTAWTDQHGIAVSQSTDGGITWSPAVNVSTINTTVMPWIAARNGKVDVSTIDTWIANGVTRELPEIVLAFEK